MAVSYIWSGATGAGTGVDWANAFTSIQAANAGGFGAGDTGYVASDHVGNYTTTTTITLSGSPGSPTVLISVNRAGSVPPVEADYLPGAVEQTTGNFSLALNGHIASYGLKLKAGVSGSTNPSLLVGTNTQSFINMKDGQLVLGSIGITGLTIGPNSTFPSALKFEDVDIVVGGNSGCKVTFGQSRVEWFGGLYDCSAGVPTTAFQFATRESFARLVGMDLSQINTTLLGSSSTAGGTLVLEKCKLNSGVTILAAQSGPENAEVILLHCDSGTGYQRTERYNYLGTMTAETTDVLGSGETIGSVNTSMKMVSTANASRTQPFEALPIEYYNSATGVSKTFTFEVLTDGVTLQDIDLFVRAAYLGSSASPLATIATTEKSILATGANLTTSTPSPDWTTTGLTTPVKQKISITFTPQMAGEIEFIFGLAKASTTVYINRIPAVS